jgi:hypothetical protein
MGSEVATRANTFVSNNDDYYAQLAQEAAGLKMGGDGKAFMKFDGNSGDYSYGQNDDPLNIGDLLAANPRSFKRGWICWKDGEMMEEIMLSIEEGQPPAKHTLKDYGPYEEENDGWSEQFSIEFRMLDEPHAEMVFKANNASKRRALAGLMKDWSKTYKSHPGELPVIEIDETEFEFKKGKRTFTKHAPVFKIVEWRAEDDLVALTEGSPADYAAGPAEEEDERPARSSRRDDRVDVRDDRRASSSRRASSRDEEPEEEEEREERRASPRPAGRGEERDRSTPRRGRY